MNPPKTFKVVLIGAGGSGKTTLLKRHLTGEFEKKYVPTLGVEVHPLHFHTNYGIVTLNIWDTAGQEKYGGLREGYFIQSDGAISFSDSTSPSSFKRTEEFEQSYQGVCPNSPLIRVSNKVDIKDSKTPFGYIPISAMSNYNFDLPFLQLIRTLTNLKDLIFHESPAIQPPEVQIKDLKCSENLDDFEDDYEEEFEESTKHVDSSKIKQVASSQVMVNQPEMIQFARSLPGLFQLSKL